MSDTIFGPMVTLKRYRRDGMIDSIELPAMLAGIDLLRGSNDYSRIIVVKVEEDKHGIVQSMTEWVRSV